MTTLVLAFKKIESKYKTKYDIFYSSSKAEIIMNDSNIDDVVQSIYAIFISNIQKSLGIDSGWMTDSVIGYNISLILYTSLPEAVMSNYQKN